MRSTLTFLLIAAAVVGCNKKSDTPVVAAPTQGAPAAAPAPAAGALTGTVLERIAAAPYCYLRLKTAQGEIWAAVPEAKVEKGQEVSIVNPMLMANFESKTLNRTFAEVYFGNLGGPNAPAPAPAAAPAMGGQPTGAGTPPSPQVQVGKVEKASGADARTIAETWAQKDGLKEKTVSIRGTVVKYNPAVMGKNWIHLQDGSGDPKSGTHDITVTTQDAAAKGETITIKGTVRLNKDFGAGYTYPLIVEEAKVTKK